MTMPKIGTSHQRDLKKTREIFQKQIRRERYKLLCLGATSCRCTKQGKTEFNNSTPPAKGPKVMWYYMLEQNWQCHDFMRQADVTMACINRSSSWKIDEAILLLCQVLVKPQQDVEPAYCTPSVLARAQTRKANPEGNKGCERCEEGDLQSTSETIRDSSSRERWVEGSTRGNNAIFHLRWVKCSTERKGNNVFSVPVPDMEKIKGLPHLPICSHFLNS